MPHVFTGHKRTSFRYADGWRHLDSEKQIGKFKVVKVRELAPRSNDDETRRLLYTVAVPRRLPLDTIANVLDNQFTYACRCEHDCCGCTQWATGLPRRTKRREVVVVLRSYQNI